MRRGKGYIKTWRYNLGRPQIGKEIKKKRPALVISPNSYNQTGLAAFMPITSKVKGYIFEVPIETKKLTKGVVLCDQIRTLDWRRRQIRKYDEIDEETIEKVLFCLKSFLFDEFLF